MGAWSNPLDIAPNFVGTIMGVTGLFCYLTGALVPHTYSIMSSLVQEDSHLVWPVLFATVAAACVLANTVFVLLATADTQPWNIVDHSDSREILKINNNNESDEKLNLNYDHVDMI